MNSFGGEKNLIFFNKEGDSLNLLYNNNTEKYEGKLFFDENSSDTFKTLSLYTFEKINGFDFRLSDGTNDFLYAKKFQLFNEFDINFISNNNGEGTNKIFSKIEPSNSDPNYFTKWIYGNNFEKYYTIGDEIIFNQPFTEFNSNQLTYTVINSKKNAILIISNTSNKNFINNYGTSVVNNSCTITSINAIKVKNYISTNGTTSYTTLKNWNEPTFFKDLFIGQKISVVNSDLNDSVYTVNNINYTDKTYHNYNIDISNLSKSPYLKTEIEYLSENNTIYNGIITFQASNNKIIFDTTNNLPFNISNNVKIYIIGSNLNTSVYTVTNISDYNQLNGYTVGDLILYHKKIYKCVSSYIFNSTIIPTNETYWQLSDFIYVSETLVNETVNHANVHLYKNIVTYNSNLTYINNIDLAINFVNLYKNTFETLNIDLSYNKDTKMLASELIYPSKYMNVKYIYEDYNIFTGESINVINTPSLTDIHIGSIPNSYVYIELNSKTYSVSNSKIKGDFYFSATSSIFHSALNLEDITPSSYLWWNSLYTNTPITTTDQIKLIWDSKQSVETIESEKIISVTENISREINKNYVENLFRELTLTDIDSYGLKVFVNSQLYYVETQYIYDGTSINTVKTIDKTIRYFISKYIVVLSDNGILIEGFSNKNIANVSYFNTIRFSTIFPNVPLLIKVNVGSTADYFISDKEIIFKDVNTSSNSKINIRINKINYFVPYNTDIKTTLENFVVLYRDKILQYKIDVRSKNNILYINVKETSINTDVIINVGKNAINTDTLYVINNKKPDSIGLILSSNQIRINENLTTDLFTNYDFSTAQLFTLENSYKLNNKEYNILYLDDTKMCLSYQGAFVETISSTASSGFDMLAFTNGFGYDVNANNIVVSPTLEESSKLITLPSYQAVDIFYLNNLKEYYIISNTISNQCIIYIYDANTNVLKDSILLNIEYIKYHFNTYTEYLYILGNDKFIIYDLSARIIINTKSTMGSLNLYDITVDLNGKIYLAYTDASNGYVSIYNSNTTLITTYNLYSNTLPIKLIYSDIDGIIYSINENISDNIKMIDINTALSINTLTISNVYLESVVYNYSDNSIYGYNSVSIFKINDGVVYTNTNISSDQTYCDIAFNGYNNNIYTINENGILYTLDNNFNIIDSDTLSVYGHLIFNNFDGNLYINNIDNSSAAKIYIYSPLTKEVFINLTKYIPHVKSVYNYTSKSLIGISSSNELESFNLNFTLSIGYREYSDIYNIGKIYKDNNSSNILLSSQLLDDNGNYYGTLGSAYIDDLTSDLADKLFLKVRDFIRYPRENYNTNNDVNVTYRWYFSDDIDKTIFICDTIYDLNKLEEKSFILDYIDSNTDISFIPNPLEIHIGYNSIEEGVNSRVLICEKIEPNQLIVNTNLAIDSLDIVNVDDIYGKLILNAASSLSFLDCNFKIGQTIQLNISDPTTDKYNSYISSNNGKQFKITGVYFKELILEYIDELLVNENTVLTTKNLKYSIVSIPRKIAEIALYGQTEIEDFRYKIELENTGKLILPQDTYIFKEYDIEEKGIDWIYLNEKRKEMILVRNDIFNYVGSYKAIINAINYFGYNDLILNEYLYDANVNSINYGKYIKLAIPDIFNRGIEGWNDEFFTNYLNRYATTNLFNLSYYITDEDGNNIQMYSIDEVMVKLNGLKKWLQFNVVPLSHKITDITGIARSKVKHVIKHSGYDVTKFTSNQRLTPVLADISEVYKMPVQSGSSVYNVVVDFKTRNNIVAEMFNIDIKTYKTYQEWEVFNNYIVNDKVTYMSNVYTCVENSKNRNPLEYDFYSKWTSNLNYKTDDIISYDGRYYIYQYLTPDIKYNLDIFRNDLYNESIGIDSGYLEILSDSQYSSIDIIDAIHTQVTTPNYIIYDGSWDSYNNLVLANQFYETTTYNVIGYEFNLNVSTPNYTNTINYDLNILNIDNDINNIFIGGDIYNVATINLTPSYTINANVDYGFQLSGLVQLLDNRVSIKIEYEKEVNTYFELVNFNFSSIDVYNTYIFNSNINNPKFRISIIYSKQFDNGIFYDLSNMLNVNMVFYYKITDVVGIEVYTKYPFLIDNDKKDIIASLYLNYANTNSLDYIEPTDLSEARLFVDNMLSHFSQSKLKYKLKYAHIPPIENIALDNPEFILWNDITVWQKINLEPVQHISEYRVNDMRPYNFAVDSKIDPYVVVTIITSNDYGHSYKFEKSYEIRYNADKL